MQAPVARHAAFPACPDDMPRFTRGPAFASVWLPCRMNARAK